MWWQGAPVETAITEQYNDADVWSTSVKLVLSWTRNIALSAMTLQAHFDNGPSPKKKKKKNDGFNSSRLVYTFVQYIRRKKRKTRETFKKIHFDKKTRPPPLSLYTTSNKKCKQTWIFFLPKPYIELVLWRHQLEVLTSATRWAAGHCKLCNYSLALSLYNQELVFYFRTLKT